MKFFKRLSITFSVGLLVSARVAAADELGKLAATIHYTPPRNFYQTLIADRNDPGDNPFSTMGATLLQYGDKNSPCGEVSFSLGWAGVYAGEGKVAKFLPAGPKELKELLEFEYRNKFPQVSPAVMTNLGGATAASLTATRPLASGAMPYFLHFCWIQLETNAVVKVMAVTCSADTFKALTNSMATIRVDKAQLLKAFTHQREADLPRARKDEKDKSR